VLRRIPQAKDPNLLVGAATCDDAGVYRIGKDRALVQTVDFFTPIVDDPYAYGQIAAANALSDVYAMGGRPLTAMNILGVPAGRVPAEAVRRILRGGAEKIKEAGCALVGGHTIQNPEPVYGLSVTGVVDPRKMLTNAAARPGDLLVLTKPLGTGIATTGIKRGLTSPKLARRATDVMRRLNDVGAVLAERKLVRAATDVTGFGLIGHLANVCRASGVGAEIVAPKVPPLSDEIFKLVGQDCVAGGSRANLRTAESIVRWHETPEAMRVLLTDAQTSGGLLLCVAPKHLRDVLSILQGRRSPSIAVIGSISRPNGIRVDVR